MATNHVVLGTDAIGRAVAQELVNRGEYVRMVNRSGRMQLSSKIEIETI
jgi:prephenate dehydrogenase